MSLQDDDSYDKREQVRQLQKKLKLLERQLQQKDSEIEALHKETQKIVKERDAVSR